MTYRYVVASIGTALLIGCGPVDVTEIPEHRPDLVSIGGKADELPTWMRPTSRRLVCGEEPVSGAFAGRDSAHLYHFQPLAGRQASVEFIGHYPWHQGAGVAIYDSETGGLIELLRNPWDSRVTLPYRPRDAREVVVAVYSLAWESSGAYELSVRCSMLAPGSN